MLHGGKGIRDDLRPRVFEPPVGLVTQKANHGIRPDGERTVREQGMEPAPERPPTLCDAFDRAIRVASSEIRNSKTVAAAESAAI